MLKKMLLLSVFAFSILGFNAAYANAAESKSTDVEMLYFDEDDNPIKVKKVEKSDSQPQLISTLSSSTSFGNTIFSNYVWIKNGASYRNPHYIDFELSNRPEQMAIKAYTYAGTYKGKVTFSGAGLTGWQTANFEWLARSTSYKFKFVNEGSGEVRIRGGYVKYN